MLRNLLIISIVLGLVILGIVLVVQKNNSGSGMATCLRGSDGYIVEDFPGQCKQCGDLNLKCITKPLQGVKNKISWEECVKTPGAMMTASYPETCSTPDGRSVVQSLSEEEKEKLKPVEETTNWPTYTNEKYKFSIDYPGESRSDQKFYEGSYHGRPTFLGNKIDEVFTILGQFEAPTHLAGTIEVVIQVHDKNDARVEDDDWFLQGLGYFEELNKIPTGSINYALEQTRDINQTKEINGVSAINIGGGIVSHNGKREFGLVDQAGYFIYSTLFSRSNSPYVYVVSLVMPPLSSGEPEQWIKVRKESMENYSKMTKSFKFLDQK